ncbi:MAG: polyamine-binding lipoprotein [Acidimicrobiia bacterium]|nr:MAG: polyamine-binding lipoprotein [Acidimicrobiia bacterium]
MTPRRRGSRDALVGHLARSAVTRREFLRRMGGAGAMLVAGPTLLAACGGEQAAGCEFTTTNIGDNRTLNFANWPFYIDVVEDGFFETTSIQDFESETGIDVNYLEEVNDNDQWFAKVQAQLSQCQDIERDLTVLTDWMAARFIRLGWAEQIDKSNVPNWVNLVDSLKSPGFDPNRDYTLPWQSGMTAIGYNPQLTGRELTSINDIFDPAFAGRVTMLTEMRDTMGLVMLGMGIDPSEATVDDARAAAQKIKEHRENGHIRRFTGNDYTEDLASGNVVAAFAWSGDVIQLQADNPDLRFLIPEEGLMLWSDNMLIPGGARNKTAAETWMNYVYQPRVAAKIESWVNFICPVKGAREAMIELGEEIGDEELIALADDPLIFPDDETLAKTHIFKNLDEEEEREFNELFQDAIGA